MQSKDVKVGGEYAAVTNNAEYATVYKIRIAGPKEKSRNRSRFSGYSQVEGFPVFILGVWSKTTGEVVAYDPQRHATGGNWLRTDDNRLIVPARFVSGEWGVVEAELRAKREAEIASRKAQENLEADFTAALHRLTALLPGIRFASDSYRREVKFGTMGINTLADLLEGAGK